MSVDKLERQAAELDLLLTALIKRYQFRNRNRICCEDVTVSQCYVLKELSGHGTLAMTRLAGLMRLGVSSLTRVVDQLESKGYATRRRLPADRRVVCVEMTPAGKGVLKGIDGMIRRSEKEALVKMTPAQREGLLAGLRTLNDVIDTCGTWKDDDSS
ncbi:MAG TPA: MarR family transcriptional regulator [Candidatus Polarisedimenticolia bacterium]|jgi:DNA-binding MarR family transcriptional regulator